MKWKEMSNPGNESREESVIHNKISKIFKYLIYLFFLQIIMVRDLLKLAWDYH